MGILLYVIGHLDFWFLVKGLFISFSHFSIGLFAFLTLICSFYVVCICALCRLHCVWQLSCYSLASISVFIIVTFEEQKLLVLMWPCLSVFCSMISTLLCLAVFPHSNVSEFNPLMIFWKHIILLFIFRFYLTRVDFTSAGKWDWQYIVIDVYEENPASHW